MPRITSVRAGIVRNGAHASMRPGRYAPDNAEHVVEQGILLGSFNEAGALCPG